MTAPEYDAWVPAAEHGGRFSPDPPAFDVVHSTEGPMADGNARALAENWFGRPSADGGAGTSTTGIFDPTESVRMLDEHTIPYHVGPVGNGLSTGDEHCGSVNLTPEQWMSARGQAMLDRSARVKAARARYRGWLLSDCRWLSLTEVAQRTIRGFCTHNDVRLALGGTTHSDPGRNFPYIWYMNRIRYWFQNPNGTYVWEDNDMVADPQILDALAGIKASTDAVRAEVSGLYRNGFSSRTAANQPDPTHLAVSVAGTNQRLDTLASKVAVMADGQARTNDLLAQLVSLLTPTAASVPPATSAPPAVDQPPTV